MCCWRFRSLGIYPVFMMKLLCFAMFAGAFNLLLGFSGMLSFGHAAFFGSASYATGLADDGPRLGSGRGDPRRDGRFRGCSGWASARLPSAGMASISR